MIRTLAMIAVAGFLLSVVCLSVAIRLAGPEMIANGAWNWSPGSWNFSWSHGHHHMRHETAASRDLAWSGGESLVLNVPADVRFTQSDGPAKVSITGPQDTINSIVVENGQIRSNRGSVLDGDGDGVTIEVTAPHVTRFEVHGSERLQIQNYRQDRLDVTVTGQSQVIAQGATKALALDVSGTGDADLGGLAVDGADVKISGSGHAKLGPRTWAKLDISGTGDVDLLGHPKQLETHIAGSGHIDQDEDAQPAPPAEPQQPAKPATPAKAI